MKLKDKVAIITSAAAPQGLGNGFGVAFATDLGVFCSAERPNPGPAT